MFKAKKIYIDSSHSLTALLNEDDAKELCLNSKDRIEIISRKSGKKIICELFIIDSKLKKTCPLEIGEIGLFESAFNKLESWEHERVSIVPAQKAKSLEFVKKKFLGQKLNEIQFQEIISDIAENRYSDIETTFFVLACSVHKLNFDETVSLTQAMIKSGKVLNFKKSKEDIIVDKHCIGGIPNNRTSMIIIPIIASAGIKIPKTSSRAITSPAGTADTMEVLANVSVSLSKMHEIIEKENACLVWGGAFDLSPADDLIIHVEHPLGLDFEVQMIASILSKKKSAGSEKVLLDIPIGPDAKVKNEEHGLKLKSKFEMVGKAIGLEIKVILTEGNEAIGNGVGPLLEAMDVLKILKNEHDAPRDLKEKALMMSGMIFHMAGHAKNVENGIMLARHILESGIAYSKFEKIISLQGKNKIPPLAKYSEQILNIKEGNLTYINIKQISKIAFMLGAPKDKAAGMYIHKKIGEEVKKGEILLTLYSNSKLKLKYALNYIDEHCKDLIKIK